jgi:olfactory receptor
MAEGNHSTVTGFILAVLSDKPQLQLPLFLLFLGIYLFTVGGEPVIITLIGLNPISTPQFTIFSAGSPSLTSAIPPSLSPECW